MFGDVAGEWNNANALSDMLIMSRANISKLGFALADLTLDEIGPPLSTYLLAVPRYILSQRHFQPKLLPSSIRFLDKSQQHDCTTVN